MNKTPKKFSFRQMPKSSKIFDHFRNLPERLHERKDKVLDKIPPIIKNMQMPVQTKFGLFLFLSCGIMFKTLWSI
jgi:hypothetical protein